MAKRHSLKNNAKEIFDYFSQNGVEKTAKKYKSTPAGIYKLFSREKMNKEPRWSEADVKHLLKNYKVVPLNQLAKKLSRPPEAVRIAYYKFRNKKAPS